MGVASAGDLAWVRAFRRAVAADMDAVCALVQREVGKRAFETVTSDVVPLLASCRWHERHARRVVRARRVRGGSVWQLGQRHRVVRAPLGRVAIIATWNYPVQLLGVQLVQAVVGGNRVVVKPSERCPETHARVLGLARDAGLGEDRLTWTDATRDAGERLLQDEAFDHVVFTGSTAVGRAIAGGLGESLTASTLELSGQDSAIVLADADVDLAARSILYAVCLNKGRTCMAPRRVIVEDAVAAAFEAALARHAPAIMGKDASGFETPEQARADELRDQAVAAGGRAIELGGASAVADAGPETGLARGDHFGAAVAIVRARSADEAFELHRGTGQHLATAVFTKDARRARAIAATLGAGVVTINDCVIPTGHPGASIGGRGASGWGVSRGELGLLSMTRAVFVSQTGRVVRTPIARQGEDRERSVARFVRWWYGR